MKKFLVLAPCVALIFACSGGGVGGGAASMQPGQWEMVIKPTDVQAPSLPPAMIEQMKSMMASQTKTQSQCLTQAEIDNMGNRLGQQSAQGTNCNFTKATFAGGSIDVAGSCQGPTGNVETTTTGTYTADTLNATTTAKMNAMGQEMTVTGVVEGRRTGDCPA